MDTSLFLSSDELKILTGISKGKGNKTRDQLQADWLRTSGLAYKTNARGAPIVYRSQFMGQTMPPPEKTKWQPRVISAA